MYPFAYLELLLLLLRLLVDLLLDFLLFVHHVLNNQSLKRHAEDPFQHLIHPDPGYVLDPSCENKNGYDLSLPDPETDKDRIRRISTLGIGKETVS